MSPMIGINNFHNKKKQKRPDSTSAENIDSPNLHSITCIATYLVYVEKKLFDISRKLIIGNNIEIHF